VRDYFFLLALRFAGLRFVAVFFVAFFFTVFLAAFLFVAAFFFFTGIGEKGNEIRMASIVNQ
jgi:hypothetical protein